MTLTIGASLLLAGCGGTSQSDLDKAKAAGASEEVAKQKQKSLEDEQARIAAELKKLQQESAQAREAKTQAATPGPAVVPGATPAPQPQAPATTSCGDNVSVSSNTSCAFAANVKAAFFDAGGGTNTIEVYSPTTGKLYSMRCVAGVPTACRGGNNAVVYLR